MLQLYHFVKLVKLLLLYYFLASYLKDGYYNITTFTVNITCTLRVVSELLCCRLGVIEWMDKTAPLKELLAEALTDAEQKLIK